MEIETLEKIIEICKRSNIKKICLDDFGSFEFEQERKMPQIKHDFSNISKEQMAEMAYKAYGVKNN